MWDIQAALVSPAGQVVREFTVVSGSGDQDQPVLAFDGTNYLVAWRDTPTWSAPNDDTDIRAARISTAGNILDTTGIPVVALPGTQDSPRIAFDGSNYLVVWLDVPATNINPPVAGIYGRRFSPAGIPLDGDAGTAGIAINTVALPKSYPTVVFDGTGYFIAWSLGAYSISPPVGIHAARVSTAGVLIEPAADSPGIPVSNEPEPFTRFVHTAVAGNGEKLFLAWVNNIELSGELKSVLGKLLDQP